jgi:hypothetical protein
VSDPAEIEARFSNRVDDGSETPCSQQISGDSPNVRARDAQRVANGREIDRGHVAESRSGRALRIVVRLRRPSLARRPVR